jgi:hypothetical protein
MFSIKSIIYIIQIEPIDIFSNSTQIYKPNKVNSRKEGLTNSLDNDFCAIETFCPHPQPLSQNWERGARAGGSGGVRAK